MEAVARYGGVPPYAETQGYVARVLRLLAPPKPTAAPEAGTFYRYEAPDGRTIYTNVPFDRLSGAVRAMLEESR